MTDMSKLMHPEPLDSDWYAERGQKLIEALVDNAANQPEMALSLPERLQDAEQLWRYFCRRDEMNAEIHLQDGPEASVRYSPITIAAERVCGWLARLYYGETVDYRTSLVETGKAGVPVTVSWTHDRGQGPDELWRPTPSEPQDMHPGR